MTLTTQTMGPPKAAFIISEANGNLSRDNGVLAQSQTIEPGQVLGTIATSSGVDVAAVIDSGVTGTGTVTLGSPAYTSAVQPGAYRAVCIQAISNSGKFRVEDPGGKEIGTATVGTAFTKQVKFTINDGATDWVVGDGITILVEETAAATQLEAWDPNATDGSQVPTCIAIYPAVTGSGVTQPISVVSRHAELNATMVVFNSDATTDQIEAATVQLAKFGLILR